MSTAKDCAEAPWIAKLNKYVDDMEDVDCEQMFAVILKDYLLCNGAIEVADTARQIDSSYEERVLPPNPLMKFEDDEGMGGFLTAFWNAIFEIARIIPFDNSHQDQLVQVITELRKLPVKEFNIYHTNCLIWTTDPVFSVLTEDHWNGSRPSGIHVEKGGNGEQSLQEICDEAVNFYSFLARCINEGHTEYFQERCRYPAIDIPEGLERDFSGQPALRDQCLEMIAIQYILLMGRALAEDFLTKHKKHFCPSRWQRWQQRLEEVSRRENVDARLAIAAEKARKYMASLYAEFARTAQGGL